MDPNRQHQGPKDRISDVEAAIIGIGSGLLSSQGEKSIDFYFIRVPLRKKSIKVWYSKAQGFWV